MPRARKILPKRTPILLRPKSAPDLTGPDTDQVALAKRKLKKKGPGIPLEDAAGQDIPGGRAAREDYTRPPNEPDDETPETSTSDQVRSTVGDRQSDICGLGKHSARSPARLPTWR